MGDCQLNKYPFLCGGMPVQLQESNGVDMVVKLGATSKGFGIRELFLHPGSEP